MARDRYAPPLARVDDPKATRASIGIPRSANLIAMRFAASAATVVAVGAVASELITDHSQDPFGPPSPASVLIMTLILSIGTFGWSWFVSMLTANAMAAKNAGSVAPAAALGIAFALLTVALGYALSEMSFWAFIASLGIWVVGFPIVATLILVRRASPPNQLLEHKREE